MPTSRTAKISVKCFFKMSKELLNIIIIHSGRQREIKGASRVHFAFQPNFTVVGVDDMLANRKPQPGTAAGTSAVGFVKTLKDPILILLRDPDAVITDFENDLVIFPGSSQVDVPSVGRKFYGIMDQIDKDL